MLTQQKICFLSIFIYLLSLVQCQDETTTVTSFIEEERGIKLGEKF
jgi:hypothetical protein